MGVEGDHVTRGIEAVVGVINIALVVVTAIAIVGIERDQVVCAPVGELMLVHRRPNVVVAPGPIVIAPGGGGGGLPACADRCR